MSVDAEFNGQTIGQKIFSYERQLDYPKALEVILESIGTGKISEDVEAIYKGACYSFALRDYQQACDLTERALTLLSVHVDAKILRGKIFLYMNQLHDALSTFESIIVYCKLSETQKKELRDICVFFIKNNPVLLQKQYTHLFEFMSGKIEDTPIKINRVITDSNDSHNFFPTAKHLASPVRIGFYIKWPKNSLSSQGNVIGDELYAEAMCRVLRKFNSVVQAELYAPNHLPKIKQDIMIYLNDTPILPEWADKHVVYMQNGYNDSIKQLEEFYRLGYDGFIFISNKLFEIHCKNHEKPALFLPFGVDTDAFYPRSHDERLKCAVAYVGNDIKGTERSMKFLYPAIDFDFALYGRWFLPYPNEIWKNDRYKLKFAQISKGKILQEQVPVLYSTADINLNCTLQDCINWDVITLRTYEVLACKGFLISDASDVSFKELSDCVVFTEGGYDLKEKIKYYLAHPDERMAYAERGYEYVIEHATIEARMKKLFNFLSAL